MESVIADGDLSKLTSKQRVEYYHKTCESLGLNPLTRPLEYQRFNGKVVLYARKECTEQLRFIHKVSIYKIERETFDGVYVVTAYARTGDGKEDASTGAVPIMGLKGENLANAFMKAETKSKRRVTLSICGMGFLDETEVNTIAGSQPVNVDMSTGEIIDKPKKESTMTVIDVTPKKTNEQVMEEIAPARQDLIDAVAKAETVDQLKTAYAKAYTAHAGRLDIMEDITAIKDHRKKVIEEYNRAVQEGTFDDPLPAMDEESTPDTYGDK
jgi:hypothetical protein